ncbi:MAG TPA: DUF6495 family protein [Saprospiraceae bacterium]|mgnify:CR=1 FL=1|nr:DUF6495 family protein [Saprospiraceae bacterium]
MQFKRLSIAELESLQGDFIKFLALQGIDSIAWESIKEKEPSQTEQLIEAFSDLIYAATLDKIQFLMKSQGNLMFIFEMRSELAKLNIYEISGYLDSPEHINNHNVKLISSETKTFQTSRQSEIFTLLESGCTICTTDVFKAFDRIV